MIISTLIGIGLGILIQYMAKFPHDPITITWLNEVSKWYGLVGYGFIKNVSSSNCICIYS